MNNLKKYNEAFIPCFQVVESQLTWLTYQSVKGWDSVWHMELITALEENLDIKLDTDDIIDFSSFEKGEEILKPMFDYIGDFIGDEALIRSGGKEAFIDRNGNMIRKNWKL